MTSNLPGGRCGDPAHYHASVRETGLGQVSEIFDGDTPHTPRGCIAQASSAGELLCAAVEDVHGIAKSMIAGA